jgi:hypothetical protein
VKVEDPFGPIDVSPQGAWLEESVDTLRRFPLELVNWRLTNSHRIDLKPGKVLPVDERYVQHWNHNPWQLDQGGDGRTLADGTSFLLPYYMGLYHGFLPRAPL